jgi:fermentation-respiration switch protein FrsA (DUF1100 family)
MSPILLIPVILVLFLIAVTWLVLPKLQDSIIYPRYAVERIAHPSPPAGTQILFRYLTGFSIIKTEAWYIPVPGASASKPAPLIVYFHGNAESIDGQDQMVALFHELGWSVLLPEYRGYGRCTGTPSQKGIRDDASYFLELVLARPEVDSKRLVFAGRSLGGGVAADLIHTKKPNALILISSFQSVVAVAQTHYHAPGFLIKHPYRTDRIIQALDSPVLLLHGVNDYIVPIEHARALNKLARHATLIEFPCGHNDFPGEEPDQQKFHAALTQFLANVK